MMMIMMITATFNYNHFIIIIITAILFLQIYVYLSIYKYVESNLKMGKYIYVILFKKLLYSRALFFTVWQPWSTYKVWRTIKPKCSLCFKWVSCVTHHPQGRCRLCHAALICCMFCSRCFYRCRHWAKMSLLLLRVGFPVKMKYFCTVQSALLRRSTVGVAVFNNLPRNAVLDVIVFKVPQMFT